MTTETARQHQRAKRDLWPIGRSELPSEKTIQKEPRLARMEENPVFRLIHFQRHVEGTARYALSQGGKWIMLIVLFFFCFPALLVVWLVATIRELASPPIRRFERITQIPAAFLGDLEMIALKPEDYALGLWGSAVTRRRMEVSWFVPGIAFMVAAYIFYLLFVQNADPVVAFWMAAPFAIIFFLLFTRAGMLLIAPYHVLGRQRAQLRRLRRECEARRQPWRYLLFFGIAIAATVAIWVALRRLLPALVNAIDWDWLRTLPYFPGIVWIELVAPCVAGLFLGLAIGRALRRRADAHLGQIAADMAFVMNWIAEEPRRAVEAK